jgi:hypothetical protein
MLSMIFNYSIPHFLITTFPAVDLGGDNSMLNQYTGHIAQYCPLISESGYKIG